ncbi:MAG TPA: DUF2845 domain-containing protein [Woeseiaceae bacterium]|nr:DUF2845 domain-containing protein [Woeseiaceae bacterium]
MNTEALGESHPVMFRMSPVNHFPRTLPALLFAAVLALASNPAHALRCGGKLVLEGMLEPEVLEHCGEPAAVRDLGFIVRSFHPLGHRPPHGGVLFRYGAGNYYQEVLVTEYIYNFGPRKLMRRLRFEGGVLADVETLGYGYLEKKRK